MKKSNEPASSTALQKACNLLFIALIALLAIASMFCLYGILTAIEQPAKGLTVLFTTVAFTGALTVLLVRSRKRLSKLLLSALKHELAESYGDKPRPVAEQQGDETVLPPEASIELISTHENCVSNSPVIDENGILSIFGRTIDPKKAVAKSAIRFTQKIIHDEFEPVIIVSVGRTVTTVPLTAANRALLKKHGIKLSNEAETDEFISNPEPTFKHLLRLGLLGASSRTVPIGGIGTHPNKFVTAQEQFTADEPSHGSSCRKTSKQTVKLKAALVCYLALAAALIILTAINGKLQLSFASLTNLFFAAIFGACAFVKAEKASMLAKSVFVASSLLLLAEELLSLQRSFSLFTMIFGSLLIADNVFFYLTELKIKPDKAKKDPLNRSFLPASFMLLLNIRSIKQITYESDAQMLLAVAVTTLIITACIIPLIRYCYKLDPPKSFKKSITLAIIFTVLLSFVASYEVFTTLNYSLDFSEPKQRSAVVTSVTRNENENSYSANVIFNGKERTVIVSKSDVENYKEGSIITFNEHRGAFGVKFYTE